MELNFVQSSEVFGKNTLAWETEFEATGDFNLHVERNKGGDILVYQRTAGSGYAIVEDFRGMDNKPAIDLDFTSVVYPKFIKIVSESQPTYATITTDGEITEIKAQTKEIEVTSNGTTEVTPDAGFAYLNSVKVKTNVAQSGGGNTPSAPSSVEYLDVSGGDFAEQPVSKSGLMLASSAIRIKGEGYLNIIPSACIMKYQEDIPIADIKAFKIDMNEMYLETNAEPKTIKEELEKSYGKEYLASIPRITEEAFYNLNA